MKTSQKLGALAVLSGSLALGAQAQVTLGSWQSSSAEGWLDHGNKLAITDPQNASKYSFASSAVVGYDQSLKITQAGWNQGLELDLESVAGGRQAFLNNHLLSFTFSVPSAAEAGVSAGYSQIYSLTLNASGYGWHDQSWANATPNSMPNFYFWSTSPARSQTVTLDYGSILPSITATPDDGYIQLVFTSNTGGGAPDYFYLNNVMLSGGAVPEPTSFALLGLGAGLLLLRKRTNG